MKRNGLKALALSGLLALAVLPAHAARHALLIGIGDAIAIRSICYATLTIDHRLVDGALAAMFLEKMRSIIENWSESVL